MDLVSSVLSKEKEVKDPILIDILLALASLGLVGDVLEFFLMSFFRGEQLVDCM